MQNLPDVLLLNADWKPLRVINWQRAIILLLDGTALRVEDYAGQVVRSARSSMPLPAVIALKKYVQIKGQVKYKRANVYARDKRTCVYCKQQFPVSRLTLDHVVPRASSNNHKVVLPSGKVVPVTCFENIVTCCIPCNRAKGHQTLEELGWKIKQPKAPPATEGARFVLSRREIPDEWDPYVLK